MRFLPGRLVVSVLLALALLPGVAGAVPLGELQEKVAVIIPEIERVNKAFDHLHNDILYRLSDRKKRLEAVNLLLEVRKRAAEMVRVVMEKSPDPNSSDNQKRYPKASRSFQQPLRRLAALFGLVFG